MTDRRVIRLLLMSTLILQILGVLVLIVLAVLKLAGVW